MLPFPAQLARYEQKHHKRGTRTSHFIGIPMIIIGLLILLSWIGITIVGKCYISFSWLLVAGVLIYYCVLNLRLAILSAVIFIPLTWILSLFATHQPYQFAVIISCLLLLAGWLSLFIGHFIERSTPLFGRNFSQIFIAPLFLLMALLGRLGLRQYFI